MTTSQNMKSSNIQELKKTDIHRNKEQIKSWELGLPFY